MKKSLLILACLASAAMVSAQTSLVKDSEQALKNVSEYPAFLQVVETLKPAFENPETANSAFTYFVPGKAAFKVYDKYFTKKSLGQPVDDKQMGSVLLDGYNFFMKALPLDSVADDKGKVKTKHSKEMINTIVGHVNDFDQAAVGFWQEKEYAKAYDAWEACLDITNNPRYAKSDIKPYADTIQSEIRFNQALAAWQANDLDKAITAFDRAISLGNNKPETCEYAYSVAYLAKNKDKMREYANLGFQKFGTSDPRFLQWTVNSYLEDEKYDEAKKLLADAIAADPAGAAPYYLSSGIVNETLKDKAAAEADYRKAIELDSKQAQAYLNLGRVLAEKYDELDQAAGSMSQAEYNKYAFETLRPILKEAAENFEQSYKINEEMTDALRYLKNIYYVLNDADNLKRVEDLLKY